MEPLVIIGGALAAVLFFAVRIFGSVASSLITEEFKVSAPDLALGLVERAVARVPADHRPEWQETWLADLVQLEQKPLQATWYAFFNCFVASFRLARDLQPALAPAASQSEATTNPAEIGSALRGASRALRWVTMAEGKQGDRSGAVDTLVDWSTRLIGLPMAVIFRLLQLAHQERVLATLRRLILSQPRPEGPYVRMLGRLTATIRVMSGAVVMRRWRIFWQVTSIGAFVALVAFFVVNLLTGG